MTRRWRALVAVAASLAGAVVSGPAPAQDRLPNGGVARAAPPGVVAAWYARPTMRYPHGALGDAVEGGSLVVEADGRLHEHVLPDRFVFEDDMPRIVDLDGNGTREIVTIRSDTTAGAAVVVYRVKDGRLEEVAATEPIGRPNRWLSIAGIADFTGDGRSEIAVVRTPHVGGVLELLSLRDGTLAPLRPPVPGYTSHILGAARTSLAAVSDLNGDGAAELILPDQGRRRLVVLGFVGGVAARLGVELPAAVSGPIEVDASGRARVPLADGSWARIDLAPEG